MSIYIALHKECELPELENYVPIQVGAALHDKLSYLTDDAKEDNISEKNPNFCELTALYYIWKNTSDDVIGLVHYRRFFYKKVFSSNEKNIVDYNTLSYCVNDNTVVLPQKHYFRTNNYEQYNKLHSIKDLNLCKKIIQQKYPDYIDSFYAVMKRNYVYPYNMFVMTRKNFNNYMKWMFNILFELENQCNISDYDAYNQRIFGFMSERLLNIWVLKNKLKIKSFHVYNNSESLGKHFAEELENKIKKYTFF